jgi:hypothetical protein
MTFKPTAVTNPELADKILEAIYSAKGMIGSSVLSEQLSVDQSEVVKIIYAIKNCGEVIRTTRSNGKDQLFALQYQRMESEVELFLKSGGFTAISKSNQQEKESQTERTLLELQHLKLEIANLQQVPAEQKRTRRLSIAAILISLLTILFEIWKTFFLKP